jgi:hypothetical protein
VTVRVSWSKRTGLWDDDDARGYGYSITCDCGASTRVVPEMWAEVEGEVERESGAVHVVGPLADEVKVRAWDAFAGAAERSRCPECRAIALRWMGNRRVLSFPRASLAPPERESQPLRRARG